MSVVFGGHRPPLQTKPRVACGERRGHIRAMDDALTNDAATNQVVQLAHQLGQISQHYLWISLIWGAIAGGYCVYGFKQKEIVPCLGGFALTAATFLIFNSLWLSLACIAIMFAVWWLLRQGY
jgi:hypothetical protein